MGCGTDDRGDNPFVLIRAYRQLAKHKLDGCVVIGLDLIIFNAAFDSPPKFIDYRQKGRHPLAVANGLVSDAVKKLVVQREEDYPSERPIDGAILTLGMWGISESQRGSQVLPLGPFNVTRTIRASMTLGDSSKLRRVWQHEFASVMDRPSPIHLVNPHPVSAARV